MKKPLYLFALMLTATLLLIPVSAQAAQVHRVVPGESLSLIAWNYGIPMDQIIKTNNLRHPNNIFARQVLIIPSVYTVQPGDTMYRIAQKIGVSAYALAQENNIRDWNWLYAGQTLSIPAKGTQTDSAKSYTVKPGDSLYRISRQLGVSMSDLASANNLGDWNNLYVGQVLKAPRILKQSNPSFGRTVSRLARMFKGTFYLNGPSTGNKIALTFDDGPDWVYTPQVLDLLKAYHVPATFFLIGHKAEKAPQIVRRIVGEGHVIGNHSWSHPDLRKVSKGGLFNEINQTQDILARITGRKTALLRPPYGAVSEDVLTQLQGMAYKVINWSADSIDWRERNVDQLLINTLPDVKEGSIILFHSAGGEGQKLDGTVKVLPEIIETLRMQGYTFVTIDELLGVPAYK